MTSSHWRLTGFLLDVVQLEADGDIDPFVADDDTVMSDLKNCRYYTFICFNLHPTPSIFRFWIEMCYHTAEIFQETITPYLLPMLVSLPLDGITWEV